MRHPRVRRPFSVESRGSNRESGSVAIPKRVPPSPQPQPLAAAKATRPLFDPWAAVTAPPEPAAARRILPNLMTPPEPALEPEAEAPVRDEPLPRVRRVKVKAAAARPASRPAAPKEVPAIAPPPLAAAPVERPVEIAAAPILRTAPWRGERKERAALPAGQRWKARLPRACW